MVTIYTEDGRSFRCPPYTEEENWEFEQRLRRGGDITIVRGSKSRARGDKTKLDRQKYALVRAMWALRLIHGTTPCTTSASPSSMTFQRASAADLQNSAASGSGWSVCGAANTGGSSVSVLCSRAASDRNARQRLFSVIAHQMAIVLFDHGNARAR